MLSLLQGVRSSFAGFSRKVVFCTPCAKTLNSRILLRYPKNVHVKISYSKLLIAAKLPYQHPHPCKASKAVFCSTSERAEPNLSSEVINEQPNPTNIFPDFEPRSKWVNYFGHEYFNNDQRRAIEGIRDGRYQVMVEVRDARLALTSARHPVFTSWLEEDDDPALVSLLPGQMGKEGSAQHDRVSAEQKMHIIIYTHAELLSTNQIDRVLEVTEEKETRGEAKPAIFFMNLSNASKIKSKQMRVIKTAIVNSVLIRSACDRALVTGLPNVGKSSLIVPLTRENTKQIKKKKGYHLPKVVNTPGQTRGIKTHWLSTKPKVFLIDTPGISLHSVPPSLIRSMLPRHQQNSRLSPNTVGSNNRMRIRRPGGQKSDHVNLKADKELFYKLCLAEVIPSNVAEFPMMEIADYALWILNRQRCFVYVELLGLSEPQDDIRVVLDRVALVYPNPKGKKLTEKQAIQQWLSLFKAKTLGSAMIDCLPERQGSQPDHWIETRPKRSMDEILIFRNEAAKGLATSTPRSRPYVVQDPEEKDNLSEEKENAETAKPKKQPKQFGRLSSYKRAFTKLDYHPDMEYDEEDKILDAIIRSAHPGKMPREWPKPGGRSD